MATNDPTGLATSTGRPYGTGMTDADVEASATVDGNASVHDGSYWGPNAEQTRVPEMLNDGHRGNAALIGHALRRSLQSLFASAEHEKVAAEAAEQRALEGVEDHAENVRGVEDVREAQRQEGLQPPSGHGTRAYIGSLVALMLGDLAFIAVAFELFGLSDRLLFGFVPYTDELHIGAAASVLALLILAHFAGIRFREVLHDLERRRRAPDDAARAALPEPRWVSLGVGIAYVVFALALLVGVAMVRSDYLAQLGVDAKTLSFAAIQLGVFAAALALSIAHAHPYGCLGFAARNAEGCGVSGASRAAGPHARLPRARGFLPAPLPRAARAAGRPRGRAWLR